MSGPRRFAPLTRVGHESSPGPCGLPVWCNEPPDTKGHHHGTQQYHTRAGDQSAGLPRLARHQQGRQGLLDPHRSRMVPPRPQGCFASVGSGPHQWPHRPAHAAGRREEGTGRLAPGLRADGQKLGRKRIVRFPLLASYWRQFCQLPDYGDSRFAPKLLAESSEDLFIRDVQDASHIEQAREGLKQDR